MTDPSLKPSGCWAGRGSVSVGAVGTRAKVPGVSRDYILEN